MPHLTGAHQGDVLANAHAAKLEGFTPVLAVCSKQLPNGKQRLRIYRTVDRSILRETLQNTLQALDEDTIT